MPKIPPKYVITNTMISLLTRIEANRTYLQTVTVPEKIIDNLTHISLLKSSVYSAKIEGNPLSLDDIENTSSDDARQFEHQEVENIIAALSYMRDKHIPDIIDVPYLLQLHRLVMHKLIHSAQAGVFRREPSAIFDSIGNVVYMTPLPSEINDLMINLLHLINDETNLFPLIKAPLAHIAFEKIHPFLDGNGRVGRLLFQAILAKHNYHFNWLLSIEEVLQARKQTYYALLDQDDATEFIEFLLQILFEESERLKSQIANLTNPTPQDFLLPRRREMLEIIRDQQTVSLDQLQRRFLKVPARTLRYDIKQLETQGFIRKIGTTRGALYQVKK